ncbi:Hypothetical protein MCB1EB_1754 [Mycoavidus cysteinexigens]|uniref:Lipopolysaccharide assembly protein A domain-containing protein n=1 Tax=Mycoavidus cysteinexigens TaxID=1553431 RepID=A0A2Z6EXS5_9BURK|nr:LapA family protein [Mycoavidus cysteinexigens]BBE09915.1 Hypothetical protein MCB1EB_1754 [Mycoavidus cysteinexigens]GLR00355.1 hypothetical protein GCM10007934_01660 [Mycoavidus cysteinexigens]
MRFLVWLVRLLVFAVLLLLALANTQTVILNFFAGYSWQAPLITIGFAFFAVGVFAGLLFTLPTNFHRQFEIGRLKRELKRVRELPNARDELPPPLI